MEVWNAEATETACLAGEAEAGSVSCRKCLTGQVDITWRRILSNGMGGERTPGRTHLLKVFEHTTTVL